MAQRRNPFDVRHPMFRSPVVRIAITAAVLGWAAVELARGAPVWALIFGAAGAWLVWSWFVAFDPADYDRKDP